MIKAICICIVTSILLVGCGKPQKVKNSKPEVLILHKNPPIMGIASDCQVTKKEDTRYLRFDLNSDNKDEYFIFSDLSGVNKAVFYLIDHNENSLISEKDGNGIDHIFCDILIILKSKTNGYHDMISMTNNPGARDSTVWKHNGIEYIPYNLKITREEPLLIKAKAYWYEFKIGYYPDLLKYERNNIHLYEKHKKSYDK